AYKQLVRISACTNRFSKQEGNFSLTFALALGHCMGMTLAQYLRFGSLYLSGSGGRVSASAAIRRQLYQCNAVFWQNYNGESADRTVLSQERAVQERVVVSSARRPYYQNDFSGVGDRHRGDDSRHHECETDLYDCFLRRVGEESNLFDQRPIFSH